MNAANAPTLKPTSLIYCCVPCGCPQYEFSDKEIDAMRRKLAAQWHQSISQVTEYEAVYYLRGGMNEQ